MTEIRISEIVGKGYDGFWTTKKMYRMCKGSKGSKKSKTAALWYIYHMMKYPLANTLVIRKVFTTMRDTCYADLMWAIHQLQVDNLWDHSVSPMRLTYKPTGQIIMFKGLDDAMKLASITVDKGFLCWVWFEEFFDISSKDDFIKLTMSIRGKLPPESGLFKQFTGTFNPWSEHSWIKEFFFDNERKDTYACTTTFRDNEFLGDEDVQRYLDLYEMSPRAARIICDGEWGIAEGLIFDNWTIEDFDVNELLANPDIKSTCGMDFGYSISYNAFVVVLVDLLNHDLWVVDEWYTRGTTNLEIAKAVTEMGYNKEIIYADPAGSLNIAELGRGLMEVDETTGEVVKYSLPNIRPALKGGGSIMNGIQRMQSFRIHIHPKCVNFIMEISGYTWEQDKDGNFLDKPIKDPCHIIDSCRYSLEHFFMRGSGRVVEAKGLDMLPEPTDDGGHTNKCRRVMSTG